MINLIDTIQKNQEGQEQTSEIKKINKIFFIPKPKPYARSGLPKEALVSGGAHEQHGHTKLPQDVLRLLAEVLLLQLAFADAGLVGDEHNPVAVAGQALQLSRNLGQQKFPVVLVRWKYLN